MPVKFEDGCIKAFDNCQLGSQKDCIVFSKLEGGDLHWSCVNPDRCLTNVVFRYSRGDLREIGRILTLFAETGELPVASPPDVPAGNPETQDIRDRLDDMDDGMTRLAQRITEMAVSSASYSVRVSNMELAVGRLEETVKGLANQLEDTIGLTAPSFGHVQRELDRIKARLQKAENALFF